MKKLLLFSALGALAFNASAQLAVSKSMVEVRSNKVGATLTPQLDNSVVGTPASTVKSTAKTTGAGGSRLYSFTDYLSLESTSIYSNVQLPYMWHRPNALGIYSDPSSISGLVADTITFGSYAVTFDPSFSGFNDADANDGSLIAIRDKNAYKIDSIYTYGFYGRNAALTAVVDTLRFAVVMSGGTTSDLPIYQFTGMLANFGYDTVRFARMPYTSTTSSTTGSTVVIKDVLLTPASLDDTIAGGTNRYGVALSGFNVPAGQIVGTSVTFITGDASFVPYHDTVFVGSLDAAAPFKKGMFRPMFLEERAKKFNRYFPGSYNSGQIKYLPETGASGWDGFYVPNYAWLADSFQLEYPVVEFKASCADCETIKDATSISETEKAVTNATAFPNPANSEINVRFTTKQNAKVNVTVVNTLGQLVATQNLGLQSAGQTVTATINTSALSSGMYFYTIEANGQRTTSRFSVTH